jgi:hypothetical protein
MLLEESGLAKGTMAIELAVEDVGLMVAEIQRFCQRSIQPLVERPERPLAAEQLDQLTDQAVEIGLLNFEAEAGAGLWENLDSPWGVSLSTTMLQRVAQVNAGIAYHFHQLAMGSFLSRSLDVDCQQRTIVCVQGTYGLARYSLARLLKGNARGDEDQRMLEDYLLTLDSDQENGPLLFQTAEGWQRLLVPCLTKKGNFAWALFQREGLQVQPLPPSHGLDETLTWQWQPQREAPEQLISDEQRCLETYTKIFNVQSQALLAIALGALKQAYDKALEYTAIRVQGGKVINQHVAVQQMLAGCLSTIQTVELLCESVASLGLTPDSLAKVIRVRAQAHNLLCKAANDALQVFGGLGYMRETGLEKIVRDSNHLRLLCGTPSELSLFLSEWESDP